MVTTCRDLAPMLNIQAKLLSLVIRKYNTKDMAQLCKNVIQILML